MGGLELTLGRGVPQMERGRPDGMLGANDLAMPDAGVDAGDSVQPVSTRMMTVNKHMLEA